MNSEFLSFLRDEGISDPEIISKASREGEPFTVTFDIDVIDKSNRIIKGVASVESVDIQNEIITKSAIQSALEGFSQLPILHLRHTERPVGLITKCTVTERGLEIESKIPNHQQWDDVWRDVESGKLSKYSIHGRRRKFTPQCLLSIRSPDSPCITKGMYLDSISLVDGRTAVNQNSIVEIVKAMQNELISTETIIKSETDGNKMTVDTETIIKAEDVSQLVDGQITEIKKAFDTQLEVLIAKDAEIEASILEIKKGFDGLTDLTSVIEKSTTAIEELTKKNEEITKANAELSAKVDKMGDEIIQKGTNPVVIQDQLKESKFFRFGNKGV